MPESGDLLSLLETLGKTHSPSAKLRLLGNSWKLLRDLTPKQRQRLFAAQGLKQAGDLLRRLGGREERSRDLLLALADQVEKGDVDKLGTIFNRVRSGGLSEVVAEVAPALDESPEAETGGREASLLEELSSGARLLDRFRLVRNRLAELSEPGDVAQAVEAFPEGWARRRFVTRLIREGKVGFEEACQLLRQLPASGEHWGVSAILERYSVNPERLSLLQEVVRSPLSKRRVQRHRV